MNKLSEQKNKQIKKKNIKIIEFEDDSCSDFDFQKQQNYEESTLGNNKRLNSDKNYQKEIEKCKLHPDLEIKYFCIGNLCRNKLKPFCKQCLEDFHYRHDTFELSRIFENLRFNYKKKVEELNSEVMKRDNKLNQIRDLKQKLIEGLEENIKSINQEFQLSSQILIDQETQFDQYYESLQKLSWSEILIEVFNSTNVITEIKAFSKIINQIIEVQKEISKIQRGLNIFDNHCKELLKVNSIKKYNETFHYYQWNKLEDENKKTIEIYLRSLKETNKINTCELVSITKQDILNSDEYKIQQFHEMQKSQQQQISIIIPNFDDLQKNEYLKKIINKLNNFNHIQNLSIEYCSELELKDKTYSQHQITICQQIRNFQFENLIYFKIDFFQHDYEIIKSILQKATQLRSVNFRLFQTDTNYKTLLNLVSMFKQLTLEEISFKMCGNSRNRDKKISSQISNQIFKDLQNILVNQRSSLKVLKFSGIQFKFDNPYSFFDNQNNPILQKIKLLFYEGYYHEYLKNFSHIERKILYNFPSIQKCVFGNYQDYDIVETKHNQKKKIIMLLSSFKRHIPFRKEVIQEILFQTASFLFKNKSSVF